jgi:hypothetical protein
LLAGTLDARALRSECPIQDTRMRFGMGCFLRERHQSDCKNRNRIVHEG